MGDLVGVIRGWLHRVWGTVSRQRPDDDLEEELRVHLDLAIEEARRRGIPASHAARLARIGAGGSLQAIEALHDQRALPVLKDLARDVSLGFRALYRERLFAISVTMILGLGIGLTVAMFGVLNAVVLRPLPYTSPNQLAVVTTWDIAANQPDGTSVPNFLDWRDQSRSFAGMTFYRRTHVSMVTFAGSDGAERAQAGLVGPDFFELLGTPPLIGRTFSHEEVERHERVVVLSEGLWKTLFAGSDDALGHSLSIAGDDYRVIGVMPRTFQLPTNETRFWGPLSVSPWWAGASSARDGDGIEVIARLKPGVRLQDATAEMRVIAAGLRGAHSVNRNRDVRVIPMFDHVVGTITARGMWLGFGAVLSLLAIACGNVGGLLAARATRRRHEFAVRSALGAGRARLVRQMLAESLSLWAVASAGGILLAYVSTRLVVAYGPATLPRMDQVNIDIVAIAVAFIAGLAAVLLSSTLPALRSTKADARAAFGVRDRSSAPRTRFQDLLVTAQIGGTVVLLVGAVLFAQSFLRAQREDAGYAPKDVLIVHIDRPSVRGFFSEAQQSLARLPGVVAVGGIKQFFLRRNPDQRVTIEGGEQTAAAAAPRLSIDAVTPGYFRSMGIELVEGRDFDARDLQRPGVRISIVNETMARRFWPGRSAIGKRWIGGQSPPKDDRWSTVIGVVKDMRREGRDIAPIASAFVLDVFSGNFDLTVRASAGAESLIPAVRREIHAIDRSLPTTEVTTAEAYLSDQLGIRRLETQLLSIFAAVGLLLSGAGLYASLSYQVATRSPEIGIRLALGAHRRSIVLMFVGKAMQLSLAGMLLGIMGAAAAAKVLQSLLYGTRAFSPGGYAGAAALLAMAMVLAAWLPARRAASVDPMTVLRDV
jgi:putative ABC transport system permease protein